MGYKYYPPGHPENTNPMIRFARKVCTSCNIEKPNTFEFFEKMVWRSRTVFTTKPTCLECCNANRRAAGARRREANESWRARADAPVAKNWADMTPEELIAELKRKSGLA